MGENRSYDMNIGGVPDNKRSHIETGHTIMGHKVLLQKNMITQAKNIMNSNSNSPIYLIGRELKNGRIQIHSINIFEGHKLKTEVNLKYDLDGRLLPYNGKESHTHSHSWEMKDNGDMGRKYAGRHEAIPANLNQLIDKIIDFNNKQHYKK